MNFNSVCIESLKNMGVQLTYFSSSNLHIWIIHAALVFTGKYTYNTTTTIQQRQKYFSHTRTNRQTHIHGQWHANNKHIQFCQEEAIKCSMPVKRAKAKEHTKRNGQLKSAEFYFFDCASKAAWIQQCSMYLPILWNAKKTAMILQRKNEQSRIHVIWLYRQRTATSHIIHALLNIRSAITSLEHWIERNVIQMDRISVQKIMFALRHKRDKSCNLS